MKRSEQDIRFQWDLTKIYPDTAAWEAAMQEAEAALAPLAAIPGTLGTSKEAFKKGLDTVYASMFKVEMPYVYAFLKKTEDGSVAENQEMAARSESLLVKFSAATAFLNPEILAIPAEKLDEWIEILKSTERVDHDSEYFKRNAIPYLEQYVDSLKEVGKKTVVLEDKQ